jgi:hypothetical protein
VARQSFVAGLLGALVCLSARVAFAAFPVELTVQNSNTADWNGLPVTSGVPLLRGQVADVSQLALVDAGGNPVPVQFLPLMTYTDGTPRWVLVDFQPTVPQGQSRTYRIVQGTAAAHPTPLQITDNGSTITVNTGPAVFVVNKSGFNLFDSVTVGGAAVVSSSTASGLNVTRASDSSLWRSNFGPATVTVEDAGPLHAVVKIVGDHRRYAGDSTHLLEYTVRIHFYAGQSFVRVFHTLESYKRATHSGNRWDSGQGGYEDFKDASLQVHTNLAGSIHYAAQGNSGTSPMTGTVNGPAYLLQFASGGTNWNHDHHMDRNYVRYHQYAGAFSGWRLYNNAVQAGSGSRAVGWMAFDDGSKGVAAGMRHFWQNCPKAIELDGADLYVRPFPKQWTGDHGFEFEGGQHKTTECFLYFYTGSGNSQQIMTGLNYPLFARCAQAHYADTFAFEYLGQYDTGGYPRLEAYNAKAVSTTDGQSPLSRWEAYDEYGWEDYGDLVADHEMGTLGTDPATGKNWGIEGANHYGNEYFATEGYAIQFARRGDLRYLDVAIPLARHAIDIHIYYTDPALEASYAGGYFAHTTHGMPALRARHRVYCGECDADFLPQLDQLLFPGCPNDIWAPQYDSGGPGDPGHLDTPYYYYFLTGDREAYDGIMTNASWVVRRGPFTGYRSRESGNVLFCLLYAYELTHDPLYRNHIISTINGNLYNNVTTGWSMSWHVDALCRYILWKRINGECDADYWTAVNSAIGYADGYLNHFGDSTSYWRYHDFDSLALLYLSLPEYHASRPGLLAKADAWKASAEAGITSWVQAKNLSVLLNSGDPHMYIKDGRISPPWPGDANRDGYVDVADVLCVAASWGLLAGDPGFDARCDFNANGGVDVSDLLILAGYWGVP